MLGVAQWHTTASAVSAWGGSEVGSKCSVRHLCLCVVLVEPEGLSSSAA